MRTSGWRCSTNAKNDRGRAWVAKPPTAKNWCPLQPNPATQPAATHLVQLNVPFLQGAHHGLPRRNTVSKPRSEAYQEKKTAPKVPVARRRSPSRDSAMGTPARSAPETSRSATRTAPGRTRTAQERRSSPTVDCPGYHRGPKQDVRQDTRAPIRDLARDLRPRRIAYPRRNARRRVPR